nr:hypothetical protein BDOA9_0101480 [Bradyrhizobium sp. DOA9]
MVAGMNAVPATAVPTSPLGEVGAERRVRGDGLPLALRPLTRFAAQIDLSPSGRGEGKRRAAFQGAEC